MKDKLVKAWQEIKFIIYGIKFLVIYSLAPIIIGVEEFFFPPVRMRYFSREVLKNFSDNMIHPLRWEFRQDIRISHLRSKINWLRNDGWWHDKIYTICE